MVGEKMTGATPPPATVAALTEVALQLVGWQMRGDPGADKWRPAFRRIVARFPVPLDRVGAVICEIAAAGGDPAPAIVAGAMADDADLAKLGGAAYLRDWAFSAPATVTSEDGAECGRKTCRSYELIYAKFTLQQRAKAALETIANSNGDAIAEAKALAADFAAAESSGGKQFALMTGADLAALPSPDWAVKGIFSAQGVVAIFGPSGSGKSFLALGVAAAMAEGREWFGHACMARPVIYVALEGQTGFRNRVAAWAQANGCPFSANARFCFLPLSLINPPDVAALGEASAATVGEGAVTFIDTLARAAPGFDENSGQDMSRVLAGCDTLQRATEGLVVLIHHSGKDGTKGLRGHSSLVAALDAAIEVQRNGDVRSWTLAKAKDGLDGITANFCLKPVDLGLDADGDRVTSCIVVEADGEAAKAVPARRLSDRNRLALDALTGLIASRGEPVPATFNLPAGLQAIRAEDWKEEIYRKGILDRDAASPREDFRRVKLQLQGRNLISERDGLIWTV